MCKSKTLVFSENALRTRLQKDIDAGIRERNDIIDRAVSKLSNYANIIGIKIDVSDITSEQAANYI